MTPRKLEGVRACVFDAYGTLFDVQDAARQTRDLLGDQWQPLAETWRAKQLQYTWLRSLMRKHVDFWQVTGDALDYAMAGLEIKDAKLRKRLMALYLEAAAYPEVKETLTRLKKGSLTLAFLSNGTEKMLASAVANAGITDLLDAVLSVEEVGVFKPDPAVYLLAVDRLGLPPERMCFVSSNAWDAHAAKAFGYQVIWCNRFQQARERIPEPPDAEIDNLSALPEFV